MHLFIKLNTFYITIVFFLSLPHLSSSSLCQSSPPLSKTFYSYIRGKKSFNQFYSHIHALIYFYSLLSSFCIKCQTLRKEKIKSGKIDCYGICNDFAFLPYIITFFGPFAKTKTKRASNSNKTFDKGM